jgi:hypothetical protein
MTSGKAIQNSLWRGTASDPEFFESEFVIHEAFAECR